MSKLEITKKLFIETINALEKQYKHDSKCAKHIQAVFNTLILPDI